MKKPEETRAGLGVAALALGMGLLTMILMPLRPEGLQVPLWVAEVAVSGFVSAGLSIACRSLGLVALSAVFNILVIGALATPGFWIMLSPEQQSCVRSISLFSSTFSNERGDLECRIVFGAGAIITVLVGLAMLIVFVRQGK